jgi:hypothetical protein
MGHAPTRALVHPSIVGLLTSNDDVHDRHDFPLEPSPMTTRPPTRQRNDTAN